MGVGRVAEQFRPLGPELQDLGDGPVVVVLVRIVAAHDEHAPHLLAQVTTRGVGEEGIDARAGIDDRPQAGLSAGRRARGRAVAHRAGQARQVRFLLQEDHLRAFLGQHVLAELRVEAREPLVQLGQLPLRRGVELRARAHERRVVEPQEPLLLGRELKLVAGRVHGADSREELSVTFADRAAVVTLFFAPVLCRFFSAHAYCSTKNALILFPSNSL